MGYNIREIRHESNLLEFRRTNEGLTLFCSWSEFSDLSKERNHAKKSEREIANRSNCDSKYSLEFLQDFRSLYSVYFAFFILLFRQTIASVGKWLQWHMHAADRIRQRESVWGQGVPIVIYKSVLIIYSPTWLTIWILILTGLVYEFYILTKRRSLL